MDYEIKEAITIFLIPTFLFFPIVLNLISAYIFSNIKFKTQLYRCLKLISLTDALSLIIIIFLPLTKCKQLCSRWFRSNYWLIAYELYGIMFLSQALRTFSSLINVAVAWIRLKTMNNSKISSKKFYLLIITSLIFSFSLHIPKITLNQIVRQNESELKWLNFTIKAKNKEKSHEVALVYCLITIIILLISVTLNIKLFLSIKEKINSKFISLSVNRRHSSRDAHLREYMIAFSKTKKIEHETSLLIIWLTLVFIIDQFLLLITIMLIFLMDNSSKFFQFIVLFVFLSIFITQLSNIFLYYRFNQVFFKRFRSFFKLSN